MQTLIDIIDWMNRWLLAIIIVVVLGLLLLDAARVHATVPVMAGPRFWVSDTMSLGDGKAVYLLHDRKYPQFCMLVLDAVTTVWTPRSCE